MKINTSADLDLKNLSEDYVFIYIDIDIHIPKIDSRNIDSLPYLIRSRGPIRIHEDTTSVCDSFGYTII